MKQNNGTPAVNRKPPMFTKNVTRKYFGTAANQNDTMKKSSILFHSVPKEDPNRLLGSGSPANHNHWSSEQSIAANTQDAKNKQDKAMYSSMFIATPSLYQKETAFTQTDKFKELTTFADQLKRKLMPFLDTNSRTDSTKEELVNKYTQSVAPKTQAEVPNPFSKAKKAPDTVDYSKDYTDFNKLTGIYRPTKKATTGYSAQVLSRYTSPTAHSAPISMTNIPETTLSSNKTPYSYQPTQLSYPTHPSSSYVKPVTQQVSPSLNPYSLPYKHANSMSAGTFPIKNQPPTNDYKAEYTRQPYTVSNQKYSTAYNNSSGYSMPSTYKTYKEDNSPFNVAYSSLHSTSSSFCNTLPKAEEKTPLRKDHFQIGKKLGNGMFGQVFLVRHKVLKFVCAMKILKKSMVREQKVEDQLVREIKIQFYLRHQNVIGLYGFFCDYECVYLLQQLCMDGHLFSMLKQKQRFESIQAADILKQVCVGLDYIHSQRIIHRDIKPQNIIMHQGVAKICDFGWAVYRGHGLRGTFCGTPLYTPPQLLRGEMYDEKFDIWAIGILAYQLLVGRFPFKIFCQDDLNRIVTPYQQIRQRFRSLLTSRPRLRTLSSVSFVRTHGIESRLTPSYSTASCATTLSLPFRLSSKFDMIIRIRYNLHNQQAMDKTRNRFRSNKVTRRLDPLKIEDSSFNQKFEHNVNDIVMGFDEEERKTDQDMYFFGPIRSEATIKKEAYRTSEISGTNEINSENQMQSEVNIGQLKPPYQFIGISSPPLHTVILPHFSFKSITFVLSIVMLVMFISLFVVYLFRPSSPTAWGCLLFQAQNRFYPRLKENYQFWRVPVSSLFHSNFSHLILNLIGLQLYGYFVEWYLGKKKYAILIAAAVVNSHFMNCLTNMATVSTTPSGILYAVLAVKILFFHRYRNYQPLASKKIALIGLLSLIFGMNIIILFVGGNVEVGGHLGGFLSGLMLGGAFYQFQQQTKCTKAVKYGLMALLAAMTVSLIGAAFGINDATIHKSNLDIDFMC